MQTIQSRAADIRRSILLMADAGQSGHLGGAASAAELLAVLYFYQMRHDPARPSWPKRDRFVLSKGHAALALYAVLAHAGYFPLEELTSFKALDSRLQGHPAAGKLPGIEASTGSLGQGLSIACGIAAALRLDASDARVYCLIGDGEAAEGQIWEAAMSAAAHRLDRLTAIVDCNAYQASGPVMQGLEADCMAVKWRAFGWEVFEADGHDIPAIIDAFQQAASVKGRPGVLIARTQKGRGFPFGPSHAVSLTKDSLEEALAALAQEEGR